LHPIAVPNDAAQHLPRDATLVTAQIRSATTGCEGHLGSIPTSWQALQSDGDDDGALIVSQLELNGTPRPYHRRSSEPAHPARQPGIDHAQNHN